MEKPRLWLAALVLACGLTAEAQEQGVRSSSSMYLNAQAKADVTIPFAVDAEGVRYQPTWGLDLQWINEQNLRKGVRHMGRENVGIGRSGFRATEALTNDTGLGNDQINYLRQRSNLFNTVCGATLPLVLTADQEPGAVSYYVTNKSCNTAHWAAMINAHVEWMQKNTQHPIVGVSPYNEPDYWTVEEGATVAKQADVAKRLRENYPALEGVAIVGGNTLNNDKALEWYQTGKAYYDWGNTHQLAGSFDTFAQFFQQLKADGKTGYADEMHNVGEAMAGLEYGMTVGIWWGFDSRARGEFCDISRHGRRLAYGEHRANWTAASVYRHDDGRVKAFIGSSERQAKTTAYQLLSTDRDVYYDSRGPLREVRVEIPGGTGYQTGQTNAERVVDITWGADVPRTAIEEGNYRLVNRATGTYLNASTSSITMQKNFPKSLTQQWHVKPIDSRIGGDFSFYDIENVGTAHLHINVQNFSTIDGAKVIPYSTNTKPDSNEQWYLDYAGDGFYYIRCRETALYLTTKSSSGSNGIGVQTNVLQADSALRLRQMWRLLPAGVVYDAVAPAQPAGLTATAQSASVRLTWQSVADKDLLGYTILRADAAAEGPDAWNTIARGIADTCFVDNGCCPGHQYIYKVMALDQSLNLSAPSETAQAQPGGWAAMTARWAFDGTLFDDTENMMDASVNGDSVYVDGRGDGGKALSLNTQRYAQLPYEVACNDEMTFCAWVNWRSSSAWQRIFDFGCSTSQYMFLTPSNGSIMRFAIKNGSDEQTVDCPSKLTVFKWHHVAVTLGQGQATIYVDGEPVATGAVSIKPSDVRPVLNYLGRSQFLSDPFFTGYIDDVRIYNHALTADDVLAVMNGLKGDVNEDGTVDVADISTVISMMANGSTSQTADVNGDGKVDVADISTIITIMANR
ncbi:MAG: RICIN domain-containing protein [Prevotella sp.]|nr:RICIN domain-containing protein [Prevotella sp.]